MISSRRWRPRVPRAAALRPRIHRLSAVDRGAVAHVAGSAQPVRRGVPAAEPTRTPAPPPSSPSFVRCPRRSGPTGLRRLVSDQVSLILRRPIDPDRPFADHGLDSLGNLELRTHIETQTGVRLTPKTIVTLQHGAYAGGASDRDTVAGNWCRQPSHISTGDDSSRQRDQQPPGQHPVERARDERVGSTVDQTGFAAGQCTQRGVDDLFRRTGDRQGRLA